MTTIRLAAALIRTFEGLKLSAYPDSGGVPTIGFGHTKGVKLGDTCTAEQAEAWLAEDAKPLLDLVVDQKIFVGAALLSFGYNCGITPARQVIEGKSDLRHYIHDRHGNVQPGLVVRRTLEYAILEAGGFFLGI